MSDIYTQLGIMLEILNNYSWARLAVRMIGTNITKIRNLPRGFILNRFKTLKYFWQALKYFYIM